MNQQTLQQVIKKQQCFFWFASYLRETVECYGDRFNEKSKTSIYYHGISENMVFPSTIALFNHPTSTTKQMSVAQRFATNNGIIISLKYKYTGYGVPYFDCQWISAFGNEDESLFIQGFSPLQIINIINCQTGNEYKTYLPALNALNDALNGDGAQLDAIEEQILSRLINNDTTMPQYVVGLFNSYRAHKKCIRFRFKCIKSSKYLCVLFLQNPENVSKSFIKLGVIQTLFDKCKTIEIQYSLWNDSENKPIIISSEYISQIALGLNGYTGSSLEKVKLLNVKPDKNMDIKNLIDSLRQKLGNMRQFFNVDWEANDWRNLYKKCYGNDDEKCSVGDDDHFNVYIELVK